MPRHTRKGGGKQQRKRAVPKVTLARLIRSARRRVMTPAEKEAQRQSWIEGERGLQESATILQPTPSS